MVEGHVLFVDDDKEMRSLIKDGLTAMGFDVEVAPSADKALEILAQDDYDTVVTDLQMRGVDGIELCRRLTEDRADVPVLVLTAFGSFETAVAAIRAGAYDFVSKPVEPDRLAIHVTRAVQHRRLSEEVRLLRRKLGHGAPDGAIIGESVAMQDLLEMMGRVATTDVTVLITGETGTGKEIVARQIHELSARATGPFVALNCAAVPETLLESELFGHVRGAFTNANADRKGLFRQASGGTIFLDEIGEMPMSMQVKLLRALQEQTVRPVGGDREMAFDARVIAATNRELEEEIEENRFREDLFYRLSVVNLKLPPLRDRGTDVLILAQHFIEKFARRHGVPVKGLSEAAARCLVAYPWPGNVRELENCMERAVALARLDQIGVEDLPPHIGRGERPGPEREAELIPLEEIERRHVLGVLKRVEGNKSLAAEVLGIDRKTLYRRLKAWEEG